MIANLIVLLILNGGGSTIPPERPPEPSRREYTDTDIDTYAELYLGAVREYFGDTGRVDCKASIEPLYGSRVRFPVSCESDRLRCLGESLHDLRCDWRPGAQASYYETWNKDGVFDFAEEPYSVTAYSVAVIVGG